MDDMDVDAPPGARVSRPAIPVAGELCCPKAMPAVQDYWGACASFSRHSGGGL